MSSFLLFQYWSAGAAAAERTGVRSSGIIGAAAAIPAREQLWNLSDVMINSKPPRHTTETAPSRLTALLLNVKMLKSLKKSHQDEGEEPPDLNRILMFC